MGNFGKRSACEMIRDMSDQMAKLAKDEGLDVLAYTLAMTNLEAANTLTALEVERQEADRPPLIPAAGCQPRRKPSRKLAEAIAI